MKRDPLHIAIIVSTPQSFLEFQKYFSPLNVRLSPFSNAREFRNFSGSFCGLIVDLFSAISATTTEKAIIRDYSSGRMPCIEIGTPDPSSNKNDQIVMQKHVEDFLNRAKAFQDESARASPRKAKILRLTVIDPNNPYRKALKTVTADISAGGCFIISSEDWRDAKELRISFEDLRQEVVCRVAWNRPWDQVENQFPGFGAEFTTIPEELRATIEKILNEQV